MNSAGIRIREYEADDFNACMDAFISNLPKFFAPHEQQLFEIFLQEYAAGNVMKSKYFVIEKNGNVAGAGGYGDKDNRGLISLAWGMIHHNFHRQGLGLLLLKYRLEEIVRLFPDVPVCLDTTQHSAGFFEKAGFTQTGQTPDYYAPGLHRIDLIWKK